MSAEDTSYAPKSPDLSSFYPAEDANPPPASPYDPPSFNSNQFGALPPANNYTSAYVPPGGIQSYNPPGGAYQLPGDITADDIKEPVAFGDAYPPGIMDNEYRPEDEEYKPEDDQVKQEEAEPAPPPKKRRGRIPKPKPPVPPPPVIEPSPVKTKFPTARIKRIMQADEEVGKVAQQTPIAVGKALELFMIQLVEKSAAVAKERGSRRVTAHMLKSVVETDEHWDFLHDIVSRLEPEKAGKSRPKTESDSDEDSSESKKKKIVRRKKYPGEEEMT
ncbi:Putative DNA polymerase II participates in chromosomal DNA replication-like protein [[Torrubiella] hemipterigena]|uniref:NCT transcriptional regulatory complex subunit A n=1 Tax=[Torrubiella] hemipterigena TaxID=1531966 RepID=A0A0A1T807_9HYPO|nr:Putative DNA polymerase II participates in chromosomal DNA replication-like protein [[Torrubiella] hemipterigena]